MSAKQLLLPFLVVLCVSASGDHADEVALDAQSLMQVNVQATVRPEVAMLQPSPPTTGTKHAEHKAPTLPAQSNLAAKQTSKGGGEDAALDAEAAADDSKAEAGDELDTYGGTEQKMSAADSNFEEQQKLIDEEQQFKSAEKKATNGTEQADELDSKGEDPQTLAIKTHSTKYLEGQDELDVLKSEKHPASEKAALKLKVETSDELDKETLAVHKTKEVEEVDTPETLAVQKVAAKGTGPAPAAKVDPDSLEVANADKDAGAAVKKEDTDELDVQTIPQKIVSTVHTILKTSPQGMFVDQQELPAQLKPDESNFHGTLLGTVATEPWRLDKIFSILGHYLAMK